MTIWLAASAGPAVIEVQPQIETSRDVGHNVVLEAKLRLSHSHNRARLLRALPMIRGLPQLRQQPC